MYLSQGWSTFLFTVVRLTLQISSIHLISHIASRQYNLTYQERINGGLLRGVKYLLFTKFQSGRKHYLGRFYVALALITTLTLNFLPTLLSDQYPVKTEYPPGFKQELDIGKLYTTPTVNLQPGKTSVEDLLFKIGVPLNGSIFSRYTASTPPQTSCKYNQSSTLWTLDCGNETIEFGRNSASNTMSVCYSGKGLDGRVILNGTTPDGVKFNYFDAEVSGDYSFVISDMYMNLARATTRDINQDMAFRGASNTEECLSQMVGYARCIRHSHGFLLSVDTGKLFIITRRAFVAKHTFPLNLTIPVSEQQYDTFDPNVNITIDCKQFPTVTLERMCRQINSLRPQHGRAFTTQQSTRGPGSITQWDVVNSLLTLATAPNGDQIPEIYIEAFHLDINVTLYNSKFKYPNLKEFSYKQKMSDYLKLRGQEVFETTYFVDKTEDRYNHSWIQYGFSSEDLHNMTSFILGGTLLNNGTIILQTPVLRANISDTVIGLLFMAALVMIICGFVASKDVPSLTRDPVTEVLSRTLLPNQDPPATKKKKNTLMYYQQIAVNALRRRRVANLTLRPEYPMEDEEERIDADAEVTRRSTGTVTTTTKPLTHRLRIDFEERDRDNSVQLVDFSNDKHNKSGELSVSPLL